MVPTVGQHFPLPISGDANTKVTVVVVAFVEGTIVDGEVTDDTVRIPGRVDGTSHTG